MCHRQKRCPHVVQLRTVTISSVHTHTHTHTYICLYTPTLLPYSTCPGDCLNRKIFLGSFPIPFLLPNSTIIAYLKTRQTASFHIISNRKSKFTLDSTQPRQPRLRHPSTYRNTSGSQTACYITRGPSVEVSPSVFVLHTTSCKEFT